jgi:hypothetical protein
MTRHRTARGSVSARSTPDNRRTALPEPEPDELDHLTYTLRDNLRRADAFITTAERQIEENWHDDEEDEDGGILRHRMRVEYLVEGGKHAVRAALYTAEQIDAVLGARRRNA